jgi:hypothetical protein
MTSKSSIRTMEGRRAHKDAFNKILCLQIALSLTGKVFSTRF